MKQVFLPFGERPHVQHTSWLIQVYQMSDLTTQESATNLLAHFRALTIDARTCERGTFLVIECSEADDALKVYEMVMVTDSHAELVYSTGNLSEAQAFRDRLRPAGESAWLSDGNLLDA